MSYQPRSTNPYIMEKKLNECVGGGGFDPSVLEEIEAEISVLGSENATMAQDIIDIKGSLNSINDNLSGFKFYPTGTDIVGLIADDSAYTDANGKYVIWGTATANQLVEDNPNTYKSIPSTEDLRGKVGADTATPFSKQEDMIVEHMFGSPSRPFPTYTLLRDSKKLVIVVANYGGTSYCRLKLNGDSIPNTYENSKSGEYRQSGFIVENVKKNDVITLDITGNAGVTIVY